MPFIDVTLTEGRDPQRLRRLITELTDAVEKALDVPRADIRVVLREAPATHFAAGDQTIAERVAEKS